VNYIVGAEEVRYTSMLDLNNLIIIIRKNREQEKQSGPSGEQK
jgi:hypothetical protein